MIGFLMVLAGGLFFPGLVGFTKSRLSGRKGPGIFQPWKDIRLLLMKNQVAGHGTSILTRIAPSLSLAALLSAALLVPFPGQPALVAFPGDFVLFAYLLGVGKFAMVLAALDTGSSFQGMGAAREGLYSMLAEPAFFVILGSLSLLTGHYSFSSIFNTILFENPYSYLAAFLAVYVMFKLSMLENSRLPVDDPKTHLELTMKHEVMILDYSGVDLALIHMANAWRFSLFGGLIANLLIPGSLGFFSSLAAWFLILILFAILAGLLESFRARNRMTGNPQFVLTLTSVAFLAFVIVLILITGKV